MLGILKFIRVIRLMRVERNILVMEDYLRKTGDTDPVIREGYEASKRIAQRINDRI